MADKHLPDLLTAYDTYILDSSVILPSSGDDFYPGAEDALSLLAKQGKQIIIFDNSPLLPSACFANSRWQIWANKGVRFYTSFGLCQNNIRQLGYFSYFLFGFRPLPGLIFMPDMSLAEFVYLDMPGLPPAYLRPENVINIPDIPQLVFASSVEPFAAFLRQARELDKILYCGSPVQTDKILIGGKEVISTKAILDYYRSLGGTVAEFGKPYLSSYEQIFKQLPAVGKILCIGSELQTDIQGAENLRRAGYSAESLLVSTLQNAAELAQPKPDHIIPAFFLTA